VPEGEFSELEGEEEHEEEIEQIWENSCRYHPDFLVNYSIEAN
jgi:hypothetical protein